MGVRGLTPQEMPVLHQLLHIPCLLSPSPEILLPTCTRGALTADWEVSCWMLWHGLLNEGQRDVGVISRQLLITLSTIAFLRHWASFRSQPSSRLSWTWWCTQVYSPSMKKDLIEMRTGQPEASELVAEIKGFVGKDDGDVIRRWRERSWAWMTAPKTTLTFRLPNSSDQETLSSGKKNTQGASESPQWIWK